MENAHYIEALILKKLQGEASMEDQSALDQWLDSDPANLQEFQELARIWKDSSAVLQKQFFDYRPAWQKMQSILMDSQPEHNDTQAVVAAEALARTIPAAGSRVINLKRWMLAASVLVILASGGWWFLANRSRHPAEIVGAEGANRQISLPDGSVIFLRKGSSVSYSGSFPGDNRRVMLHGEAYFNVKHDPANPFTVETGLATIQDIGTSFLVRDMGADEEVIVTEGRVKVVDRHHASGDIMLGAGEKALLKKNEFIQDRVADSNFIAWKTGVLDFRNTPLITAFQDIQDMYRVTLILAPDLQEKAGKQILVTAHFRSQPLEEVLEELKLITSLKVKQEKDTFVFFR